MAYQIVRIAKIKTAAKALTAMRHNLRGREVPNADPKREKLNSYDMTNSEEQALARWRQILPEKRRSDAVLLTEAVITASPGAFKRDGDWKRYLEDGVRFFTEKHGEENVINVAYHWDETTPHAHVLAVPMTEGRLSQKALYGAGQKALAKLQTDFYKSVSVSHGLERGVERSAAKHQDIRRHNGLVIEAKESKKNRLEKTQIDRAAIEYRVGTTKKLEAQVETLTTEIDDLRVAHDAAVREAAQLRSKTNELQQERDEARALVYTAQRYGVLLGDFQHWNHDIGVKTAISKIHGELRQHGYDIGQLERGSNKPEHGHGLGL